MIDFSKISGLKKHHPVDNDKIDAVENKLNFIFPQIYREILQQTNGFFTEDGILIYGADDILERNITLEVKDYAKGYVVVGDDGGDIVFLMRQNIDAKEILAVDSGDMNPDNAKQMSSDLIKWIADGCKINKSQKITTHCYTDLYDVILASNPEGGSKDLLKLKNALEFDMPTAELLKGSKKLPFLLMSNVPYGKTIKCIEKLGELGKVLKLVSTETH
jgi:hypothetical protein